MSWESSSEAAVPTTSYIRSCRDARAGISHKAAVTQSRTQDGVHKGKAGMTANWTRL